MSGHLDGPPPGPPDPPYIPGDLGAPSAEEFARRRASPTPEEWNPYAPSADWKPGQDTFTSQAAGIWAEGFAAGRAAATPDPPNELTRLFVNVAGGKVSFDEADGPGGGFYEAPPVDALIARLRAASPDERLREVLREIVRQVEKYPALSPTGIMVRDDIAGMVEGTARAALAASPDERLQEALERIIDIPLVMGGETNPTVSIADEMAHVAREALAAADRDKPGEPHEHEWRPTGYGGGSATSKRGVTTFRHEQCTVCGATSRMDLPPVSDETEES